MYRKKDLENKKETDEERRWGRFKGKDLYGKQTEKERERKKDTLTDRQLDRQRQTVGESD